MNRSDERRRFAATRARDNLQRVDVILPQSLGGVLLFAIELCSICAAHAPSSTDGLFEKLNYVFGDVDTRRSFDTFKPRRGIDFENHRAALRLDQIDTGKG